MKVRNIVILTGAGVSAESGVATFRGPDGLWEGHRVEDVATPEAFVRDPALVHAFYDARRAKLATVAPNPAHEALARLDSRWSGELLLVTQNVDDLHERAGSKRLVHMHGELARGWCLRCDARFSWTGPMGEGAQCPGCDTAGMVRPDIVWFGEIPYELDRIDREADGRVIHPIDTPITKTGGVVGLKGNLAPDGAIVKVAGMSAEDQVFTGPARRALPKAVLTGRAAV